jgi:hypothetical protein
MLRSESRLIFLIILCVSDVFQNEGFVQMVMAKHGDMDLFEFIDRNFLLPQFYFDFDCKGHVDPLNRSLF